MHHLTNRLGDSPSLYLRQHAANPVHWQPWDDAALEYARKNQKLLLISIGYAACHWCHVMEHECFEDAEVARWMNTDFEPIKIDRESRPDLDAVYMDALQIMTGRGGWPLNIIALPDGRPVFGGTYFPKEQWLSALSQLNGLWEKEPDRVFAYADKLQGAIVDHQQLPVLNGKEAADKSFFDRSFEHFITGFDQKFGGMSPAPKFPMPVMWRTILQYGVLAKNQHAIDAVLFTLERMAGGGIYDQIGGGFSRYSVDPYWQVPHFEKMLYDNAQLVTLYAEAYRYSKDARFKEVIEASLLWCKTSLRQKNGAYAAAFDADSEGVEGKYYVWTANELAEALTTEELSIAIPWFGLKDEAIWEEKLLVLQAVKTVKALAQQFEVAEAFITSQQNSIRQKLLAIRDQRIPPACDNKTLLAWNALFLEALAESYVSLEDKQYLNDAQELAHTLLGFRINGQWFRVNYEGEYSQPAFSEDLAYLAQAFFRLYQVSGDKRWLRECEGLTDLLRRDFGDPKTGLLVYSHEKPLDWHADRVELADNVQPSPNSVYARLIHQLAHLHADVALEKHAIALFQQALPQLEKNLRFYAGWGSLGLEMAYGSALVTINGEDAENAYRVLAARYLPGEHFIWSKEKQTYPPILSERHSTANLRIDRCIFGSCALPVASVTAYLDGLNQA